MSRIKNLLCLVPICVLACGRSRGDETVARRAELESCAKTLDLCEDLEAPAPVPPPIAIKNKYSLTDSDLLGDIRWLAQKYNAAETNEENRLCRKTAVRWVGMYGNTNDLTSLACIMNNPSDYAQVESIDASINLLKHSPDLIPFVRGIVTNDVSFSSEQRGLIYVRLSRFCHNSSNPEYVDNLAQHSRILTFFLERAPVESVDPLFVDQCCCTLLSSYRHSQQRRDNLAAARPPNLTGKPAELYDAAQADAAHSD